VDSTGDCVTLEPGLFLDKLVAKQLTHTIVARFVVNADPIDVNSIAYPFKGNNKEAFWMFEFQEGVVRSSIRPVIACVYKGTGITIVFPLVPADKVCVEFNRKLLLPVLWSDISIPGNALNVSAPAGDDGIVNTIVVAFDPVCVTSPNVDIPVALVPPLKFVPAKRVSRIGDNPT
jgi:hypothetical protein